MSTGAGIPDLLSVWTVFWIQLPGLVRVVATIIVTITAMRRSCQKDVPKISETAITAFGGRIELPARLRRGKTGARVGAAESNEGREQ
ncbi:hypothetical protein Ntsu_81720 [Nocardia sp. IFM 10818]